ncbi:unnamed protein product [Rhizophagus irregularis]|nr:unnamed protein product [Rhizophagus irregularis]
MIGKQGGKQELSVTTGWQNPVGSAIHKLLHSCGMFHEHSCPVRDKYVVVRRNGDCNYKKLKSSNVNVRSKEKKRIISIKVIVIFHI